MKVNKIIETVKGIHGGCFTRIRYKSDMPLKAIYKRNGWRIEKLTETTCRIGVDYNNIGSVIERKAEETSTRNYTNNYEWVIPNRIAFNTNTKEYYIQIATPQVMNTRHRYKITNDKGEVFYLNELTDIYKAVVIDSYWGDKTKGGEIRRIKLDNVISINKVVA